MWGEELRDFDLERSRSRLIRPRLGKLTIHKRVVQATRPVPPKGLLETHSTLALRSYDGKGSVKSVTIASQGSISGVTEGNGQPQLGTYEVNPDCTGKVELTLQTPPDR